MASSLRVDSNVVFTTAHIKDSILLLCSGSDLERDLNPKCPTQGTKKKNKQTNQANKEPIPLYVVYSCLKDHFHKAKLLLMVP